VLTITTATGASLMSAVGAKQITGGKHERIDLAKIFELASVDR